MRVHILYWGERAGHRDDCSIFCIQSEVWLDEDRAKARAVDLKKINDRLDEDDDDFLENFYTHIVPSEVIQ